MKSRNLEHECEIDLEILGKRIGGGCRDLHEDAYNSDSRVDTWLLVMLFWQLEKTCPPRPNTGYANSIGNSSTFSWLCLKILSWKTCHWSVINSTGASPDVDHGTENGQRFHVRTHKLNARIHKKHAYWRPQTPDATPRRLKTYAATTADANFGSHREIMSGRAEAAGPQLLST